MVILLMQGNLLYVSKKDTLLQIYDFKYWQHLSIICSKNDAVLTAVINPWILILTKYIYTFTIWVKKKYH